MFLQGVMCLPSCSKTYCRIAWTPIPWNANIKFACRQVISWFFRKFVPKNRLNVVCMGIWYYNLWLRELSIIQTGCILIFMIHLEEVSKKVVGFWRQTFPFDRRIICRQKQIRIKTKTKRHIRQFQHCFS